MFYYILFSSFLEYDGISFSKLPKFIFGIGSSLLSTSVFNFGKSIGYGISILGGSATTSGSFIGSAKLADSSFGSSFFLLTNTELN